MKPQIVFHYFLYLAIILGAFASMAQNDYGLTIVSWACFLFSTSITFELVQRFTALSWDKRVELMSVSILLFLFGLRAAYVHFAFVEMILLVISTLLIAVYVLHAINKTKRLGSANKRLRNLILVYYLSLIAFTLSMSTSILLPSLTEIVGGIATVLLALFFLGMFISGQQLIDGVEVKASDYLRKQAGYSIVLMTGYLLISLYSGLHMVGVLPSLYTDKIPQAYIELINDAETGKESAVDGVYKHEIYKEAYDKFLKGQNIVE
jgi:hypothetical protein